MQGELLQSLGELSGELRLERLGVGESARERLAVRLATHTIHAQERRRRSLLEMVALNGLGGRGLVAREEALGDGGTAAAGLDGLRGAASSSARCDGAEHGECVVRKNNGES